jgi:hypothetical protein
VDCAGDTFASPMLGMAVDYTNASEMMEAVSWPLIAVLSSQGSLYFFYVVHEGEFDNTPFRSFSSFGDNMGI